MVKAVLWAAQKNQQGDTEEFTKDVSEAIMLKWLQFIGGSWFFPQAINWRTPGTQTRFSVGRKAPASAWGIGHKSPPSVAASEPPPHLLKYLPEREILSPPDGNRICGRSLLTQKAEDHELAEL